jgi:amino acid transporter
VRPLQKAGLVSFVCIMYSYTTGGPFGLEDQVTTSGPGMTLIYHLVLPLFWCIPIALVTAELMAVLPVQGGFYRWTLEAFGPHWGFLCGWWNWCATLLLGASYAVLFSDYLSFFLPGITSGQKYTMSVFLIAAIALVNILGIGSVGKVATVLNVVVLIPFAVMVALSVQQWHHNPFVPLVPPGKPIFQVFGVGLALGLWLYSGYEQLSTVAQEVRNPQESYPRALFWVVILSVATYFVPTACALAALNNWHDWKTGYFPDVAAAIGGPRLGVLMTLGAAAMQLSILNSTVLASTRIPATMAEDGYMPALLSRLHSRFGTPWLAIFVSSLIYSLLAWKSLTQLISIYIWLRIPTSLLTVLACWRIRRKKPDLVGSFRIPRGQAGLWYAVGAPVVMSGFALIASDRFALVWGPVALVLGPVAYFVLRRLRRPAHASL